MERIVVKEKIKAIKSLEHLPKMTRSNQILENHPGDNRIFGEKPKVDKNGEGGVQDVLIWFLLTKN